MPLLILIGMLAIYGVCYIKDHSRVNKRPFTKDELDDISRQIMGKSQKEARRIIEEYHKK